MTNSALCITQGTLSLRTVTTNLSTLSIPDGAQRDAYADLSSHAFGFPVEDAPEWLARAGHENLRVATRDGRVVGGLLVIPMGQYFGGRAVSMTGVAGVSVSPAARGSGVASGMMRAFLREQRALGIALSSLFPANVPLYQRVGYERAGTRSEITVAPAAAMTEERGLTVVEGGDDAEVRQTYERWTAGRNGVLRRGEYIWRRIVAPRKSHAKVFKVHGDHGCEGYAALLHRSLPGAQVDTEVVATDVVALTARAADRLLRLFAEYGSVASRVRWYGAHPDLTTMALRDRRHEVRLTDEWMLRVLDPVAALSARGYLPFVDLSLDIEVEDADLPENRGRYHLTVRDGRGVVERSSAAREGSLRATARGLAALYSGYQPARILAQSGIISGDAAALLRADAIFAGPAPAMPDQF
jgi:predicted acetyltransferase